MNVFGMILAIAILYNPPAGIDDATAAAISDDANAVYVTPEAEAERETRTHGARITSERSDFDRKEGVAMFEGHVVVKYGSDCTMVSDRLFLFLNGTNKLSRIVALGNVAISNDTRVGTCAMAEFRRRAGEIDMFGDGKVTLARLSDTTGGESVAGSRIRFWLDTEQVEVENTAITAGQQGGSGVL